MRILEIFQPPDGGVPEHVRQLAVELTARGHEVVCAGPAGASVRTALERAGLAYRALPIVGRLPAPAADLQSHAEVRRILRGARFDAVHAHGQKAGVVARAAVGRGGPPVLYTPNGLVYATQAVRGRRGAKLLSAGGRGLERLLGRRTAALIAVARAEHARILADGLVPAERAHVVYNAAAAAEHHAPDEGLLAFRGDGPLFGIVAGLRDQKGFQTLLPALSALAAQGRLPRFAIVGNGELEPWIRGEIAKTGIADRVRVFPFAGRSEPYLGALDAFVLPSYWEGLPIAVLEAMGAGLPAIVSAVDGNPELVVHDETGLVVAPRDVAGLATAIDALADDAAARRRMGAAARERAENVFGLERMIDEIEAILRDVTDAPAPRPEVAHAHA